MYVKETLDPNARASGLSVALMVRKIAANIPDTMLRGKYCGFVSAYLLNLLDRI